MDDLMREEFLGHAMGQHLSDKARDERIRRLEYAVGRLLDEIQMINPWFGLPPLPTPTDRDTGIERE